MLFFERVCPDIRERRSIRAELSELLSNNQDLTLSASLGLTVDIIIALGIRLTGEVCRRYNLQDNCRCFVVVCFKRSSDAILAAYVWRRA